MTTARFDVGGSRTDSFLTGFFATALVVATFGVGWELGAAAADSAIDPALLVAMGGGTVASAGGLWRVQCEDCA